MKLVIDTGRAIALATGIFSSYCGFSQKRIDDRRKMKDAVKLMDSRRDDLNIRASLEYYDDITIDGGTMTIAGRELSSMYLEYISHQEHTSEAVGAFVYTLTTGLWEGNDSITESFYLDTWGSAVTEASSMLLQEQIKKMLPKGRTLSPELGPGYFGMPLICGREITDMTGAESLLGVEVLDSGMLYPQKSCCAVYIVYEGKAPEAEPECVHCQGNSGGCAFCSRRK